MPRPPKPQWHRGNRCWYARIGDLDSSGRSRAIYFTRPLSGTAVPRDQRDEAGAWAYFHVLRRERESRWIDTADPTVRDLAELYLAWCRDRVTAGDLSPGHFRTLQTRLGKFAAFDPGGGELAARRARTVTVDDLDSYVRDLRATGYRPHYIKNCARGVQGLFSWAARPVPGREPRRLLDVDPLAGYRAPGVGRMPERFAERHEAAVFLRAFRRFAGSRRADLERFDRTTILLERVLIRTGCRPGEACRMRWEEIRWEGGTTAAGHRYARVVQEEHKTAKKTEKPRVIYLTPTLTRALRRLRDRPGRHPDYVFTHARGTRAAADTPREWGDPWDSIALARKVRQVRREAIAAGAQIEDVGANRLVNYRWRHTAASTMLMLGLDPATVAEALGTSPEMLRLHYAHLLDSHLGKAAERLAYGRLGG